jgi:succinoglycan biosynthesis protein ExoO
VAVVISPLQFGSGLKIKLIETLAQGKAMVATGVTLQGVQEECAPAVRLIDNAEAFAEVVTLLTDPALRSGRAAASLQVARDRFSAAACYAELLRYIRIGRMAEVYPIRNVAKSL